MEKLYASIEINAPKEKVWNVMFNDETYRKWTTAFEPGSHYEGSWEEGSEIRFLSGDKKGGMFSRIKENRPFEFVSIEHVGFIANGEIDTTSEEVKKWAPALENYTFSEEDGKTILSIEQDMNKEHKEEFERMWKEALKILKELAEQE